MAQNGALPVASDYATYAEAAVQTALFQKQALEHGSPMAGGGPPVGVRVTPEQFADTLALSFCDTATHRDGGASMSFAVQRIVVDGEKRLAVQARDAAGSGVDMSVGRDFSVNVLPVQGLEHHASVALAPYETEYRLNPDAVGKMPYVERRLVGTTEAYVPVLVPGDDRPGVSRQEQFRNMTDSPGQSAAGSGFSKPENSMPRTMTLLTAAERAGSELFCRTQRIAASDSQRLRTIRARHVQRFRDGRASVGRGTVLYDKTQLEAHARDPQSLERELERGSAPGGSAAIAMSGGEIVDARALGRGRDHLQGHEPPSMQR